MCTMSPVYAAGEREIQEAFCQMLRRCPNNIWDWSSKYESSIYGMQDIVKIIATSDEFFQKNLASNPDVIAVLYQKLLGRNPDPSTQGHKIIFKNI